MKNAVYLLEADFLFKLVGNAKIFVLEGSEKNRRFKSLPAPKKTPTA